MKKKVQHLRLLLTHADFIVAQSQERKHFVKWWQPFLIHWSNSKKKQKVVKENVVKVIKVNTVEKILH